MGAYYRRNMVLAMPNNMKIMKLRFDSDEFVAKRPLSPPPYQVCCCGLFGWERDSYVVMEREGTGSSASLTTC